MIRSTSVLLACLFLAACASVDPSGEKAKQVVATELGNVPDSWQSVADKIGPVENNWVESFADPQLDSLVKEAQDNNRDLRAAAKNVERSWLLAKKSGASLSPQVNATLGASQTGSVEGESGEIQNSVGVQVNWEVDVWGRIRSGKQAATGGAEAVEADYRYTQLSIASAVARAYFGAINAGQQAAIAKEVAEALAETKRIVNVRKTAGLASSQDVALTETNLANANDTFEQAKAGRESALRALEVLIGRYPAAEIDIGSTLPSKPADPPVGLPSELLERRPDLIAAERRVAAAMDSLDAAKAARLPSFSLSAGVNGASQDLADVLNPSNLAWRAAANLLAPLIDGGARKTQVEINTAEKEAAIEAYAGTALKAFSEVEQALAEGRTLSQRKGFLETAADSSKEALRLARLQYDEGEIDLLSVLQIQSSEFESKSNLLTMRRLELDQFVDLSLALGGDW